MKPLCLFVLLVAAGFCHAEEVPTLEREGEELPIVKMPLGKLPAPKDAPEPPLLKKGYPTKTEVALEGQFEMADKDFHPFQILVEFRIKSPKHGWVTAQASFGGKPVKVKDGVYRYRSVIETPTYTRTCYAEVYRIDGRGKELISSARVDIDEDLE